MTLPAGALLGPYEVVRLLGTGGMGQVYLARDTRLDRQVAIKIIPPAVADDAERLRRFKREARTASSLNHPNIAHVYEIGEADGHHYIAMEYVRGETLAERIGGRPLPIADVIVYATQIADALDEAHSHGVVHRDIKPGNVIISSRNKLKVLDFGLAKIDEEPADGSPGSTHEGDTVAGLVLGTLHYMSPEQIRGQQVDRRSDIFSFGSVLYEMITGRLPFEGTARTDTIYRITQAHPDPVTRFAYDVPAELDRIVRKCLEKEPPRRYQSVRDLLVDLSGLRRDSSASGFAVTVPAASQPQWLRRAVVALAGIILLAAVVMGFLRLRNEPGTNDDVVDSLAVVPVVDADADAQASDLTMGLAGRLVNSLSDLPNLRLAPRRSSFGDAGAGDPLELARRLGMHGALTVEVTRRDEMATVTIDLQDVRHPDQLWGYSETKKLAEIESAQETISDKVAEALELRFSPEDRQEREAFRLTERGRILAQRRTAADVRRAIEHFEQAVSKKRDYAPAHAGLAQGYNLLQMYSAMEPEVGYGRARQAAQRALLIDPALAEAHTQLGWVRFRWDWDWAGAATAFQQAIDQDPDHSLSRLWLGNLLMATGRFNEALDSLREAQRLDPLSPVARAEIAYGLFLARRYQEAVTDSTAAAEIHPGVFMPLRYRGLALLQLGRGNEAITDLSHALEIAADNTVLLGDLAHAYGATGRRAEGARLFNELFAQRGRTYVSPFSLAVAAAGLADAERTLEWLQRAFLERANMLVWVNVDPRFDFLRHDPRFVTLIKDLHLPQR